MASLAASLRPSMSFNVDPQLLQASHSPHPPTLSLSSTSSRRSSVARGEPEEKDSHPNTYQIAPPPEKEYPNPKAAEEAIHAWTKALHYGMSRTKGDKNKDGNVYKQHYKCAMHGKPSNTRKLTEETRVRRRAKSRKTGCPMGIIVRAVDPKAPEGKWKIQHQMNGRSFNHNHPLGLHASASNTHRRRAFTDNVKSVTKKYE